MKIIGKKILVEDLDRAIVRLEVFAPLIAKKAKPGQFVVVMATEKGERIPLTIVDSDIAKETITLIIQETGFTTQLICELKPGDSFYALLGPLGHPTPIENYGSVILVAGGVGIAEIYSVAKSLKNKGNEVNIIVGAKKRELFFLEKELRMASDAFFVTTDNGSYGKRGFVTDVLKELLEENSKKYSLIYTVGPIVMMENVSKITKKHRVKTLACLSALMLDATGMCGCCRVSLGEDIKFACVDGPDFDASEVDWQELRVRSRIYEKEEKHICNLYKKHD